MRYKRLGRLFIGGGKPTFILFLHFFFNILGWLAIGAD